METRHYRHGDRVPFCEDKTHEFKAHRNLCVEDLPPWAFVRGTLQRTRKAISRTLNGFLNTGIGGTVYLGVIDCGIVKAFLLTSYQKTHIQVALDDLMRRYVPVVLKRQYRIEFVPTIHDEDMLHVASHNDSGYLSDDVPPPLTMPGKVTPHSELQLKSHKLRSSSFCWCDLQAKEMIKEGIKIPSYVVEITILPFVPRVDLDPTVLQLHPIYEDEEGRVYHRGSASLHSMKHQEVAEMTRRQARNHFEKILRSLRQDLLYHEKKLGEKHHL